MLYHDVKDRDFSKKRSEKFAFRSEVDILLCAGFSDAIYQEGLKWLKKSEKRRLFFIGPQKMVDHRCVAFFPLETPLDVELMARKAAWDAVMLSVGWYQVEEVPWFSFFKEAFETFHRGAGLLLSDAADWGIKGVKAACRNLSRPFKWALDLEKAFVKVPAIIVGAGPSLAASQEDLKRLSEEALIFAGGSAIHALSFPAHVQSRIDPHAARVGVKKKSAAPFCFTPRLEPSQLEGNEGPLLLAPDAHFSFLNWIAGLGNMTWEGGWTVVNFMTQLAVSWGCDPIIFVGVDACYQDKKGALTVLDREGKARATQLDWLEAVRFTGQLAKKHPTKTWINATKRGLRFPEPIEERDLSSLSFIKRPNLKEELFSAIEALPFRQDLVQIFDWKRALLAQDKEVFDCKNPSASLSTDLGNQTLVEQTLLKPLWELWEPVFRRTLAQDVHPISDADKMNVHKELFFNEVIKEHIRALA